MLLYFVFNTDAIYVFFIILTYRQNKAITF